MSPLSAGITWESLQAEAHLPQAQEVIRQEILKRTIRVEAVPGGGIRIVPRGTDDAPRHVASVRMAPA